MPDQINLGLQQPPSADKDIFLCHNGADKPWVEMLAQRVESQPYQKRNLAVVFDKWDFSKGGNIVLDIERYLDAVRFVGIVVSRAMLNAECRHLSGALRFGLSEWGTRKSDSAVAGKRDPSPRHPPSSKLDRFSRRQ